MKLDCDDEINYSLTIVCVGVGVCVCVCARTICGYSEVSFVACLLPAAPLTVCVCVCVCVCGCVCMCLCMLVGICQGLPDWPPRLSWSVHLQPDYQV